MSALRWLALAAAASVVVAALVARDGGERTAAVPSSHREETPRAPGPVTAAPPGGFRIHPSADEVARGGSLRGKVLLPEGSAFPTVGVVRLRPSRFLVGSEGAATADLAVAEDGSFAAEGLPYGSYDVRIHAPGWTGIRSSFPLQPIAPAVYVEVRAVPTPDLAGVVRDASRASVASLRVAFSGRDDDGARVALETTTAADGTFRFRRVPDGAYTVAFGAAGAPVRPPLAVEVTRGTAPELTVEVPPLGGIDVHVVRKDPPLPEPMFLVSAIRTGDASAEAEQGLTDFAGTVEFRNLVPGSYSLHAVHEDFDAASATVRVVAGKTEEVRFTVVPR